MTNEVKDRGFLTTHVLDTARGCPAGGIEITLFKISADYDFVLIGSGETNHDGRLPKPILAGNGFKNGQYQLIFHVSSYLKAHFKDKNQNLFLEEIPIRFRISKAMEHYHVPLLLSPFGYSTYRGS
ncbi:MAG: hydroxyisourate hydrolase [Paracoccaceae bacterium]|nr:hydroxyisourate hydrolase [Paracoccaceae bacterium]